MDFTHAPMVHGGVMFSKVVSKVILPSVPINAKLALFGPVTEPVEAHINGLGALLFHSIVDNAIGSIVVSLEQGGWLGEPHGAQTITDRHCFLSIHEEGS